jgi:hypothetical protein
MQLGQGFCLDTAVAVVLAWCLLGGRTAGLLSPTVTRDGVCWHPGAQPTNTAVFSLRVFGCMRNMLLQLLKNILPGAGLVAAQ